MLKRVAIYNHALKNYGMWEICKNANNKAGFTIQSEAYALLPHKKDKIVCNGIRSDIDTCLAEFCSELCHAALQQ